MKIAEEENRTKQIVIGVVLLTLLAITVGTVILFSHSLPGVLGEWISMMVGLMTTPVILESSAFIIGLMGVLAINHWREKRAGDEFVYLEQVDGAAAPADLPEPSKKELEVVDSPHS